MIKRIPDNLWFPFWVDKWIFGSMRIEFKPVERAIWIDLLALAAKDNGYIRANKETPYLDEQLAGLLVYDINDFKNAVEKFVEKKKLTRDNNGILYVTNWEKYTFSNSYKRNLKYRIEKIKTKNVTNIMDSVSSETDSVSSETDSVTHETDSVTHETDDVTHVTDDVTHNITEHNITEHNIYSLAPTYNKKLKIEFDFQEKEFKNIQEKDIKGWESAYPACDIDIELAKMKEWIISNPKKGKKKNWRRFITNWLSIQQDRGGTKGLGKIKDLKTGENKTKIEYPPGYWEKVRELKLKGLDGEVLTQEINKIFKRELE